MCWALTGCAGSGVTIPKEVRVPVPVACVDPKDRPARPPLRTDAEILALDSYRAIWALWLDREDRQGYELRLEAVVEGCSRIPPVTP